MKLNSRLEKQVPCRLRYFSLGSVLLLLITNIWLIFRQLNYNQCPPNQKPVFGYQDINRKNQREKTTPKEISRYQIKNYDLKEEIEKGFNISFQLGRWDKSRLFKMYDFISVGKNFSSLSEKYSICMATQSSIEKLHSIVQVAQQWAGPISAGLFAAGDEEYFLLHWYISLLKKCFPSVNLKVSFHLAVSKYKIPTGKYPEKLKELHEKDYQCSEHHTALKKALRLRSTEIEKWRTSSPYPQNHLRNLARKNCQSENVFLTDIDIIPSRKLAENLDVFLKSRKHKCPGKCAYVIPTYELNDQTDFPKNKKDLIRLREKGLARAFHYKVFIYNQYATNFSRWEAFRDYGEDEVVISHSVTNFEFLYEPFYVAPDTVPEHDERFLGYGYTRNSQVSSDVPITSSSAQLKVHWMTFTFVIHRLKLPWNLPKVVTEELDFAIYEWERYVVVIWAEIIAMALWPLFFLLLVIRLLFSKKVYEMYVEGYEFQVLSPVFTIHWGLQGRRGRPPWRERQNSLNREQFEVFKREVFARHLRDPLKMISG